jgi:Methyltransferase domain.
MLDAIKQKIERKRGSKNIFWRFLLACKDSAFRLCRFLTAVFNRKGIFETIYKKNEWIYGSGENSLPENTVEYRKFLQKFLKDYEIKSVIDVGCGDWQFSKFIDWSGINYVGVDIVKSVIIKNKKEYEKENIHFYCKDAVRYTLSEADLIIIKDVLQHLSNKNVLKILRQLKKFKYVLLINDFAEYNTDCRDGRYRALNLNGEPFNLNAQKICNFNKTKVFFIKNGS